MKFNRIFLLFGIFFLGACTSILGSCTSTWDEEVMLSDGRIILVKRSIVRERGGDEWAINRSGSKPKLYTLEFQDPDKSDTVIKWQSKKYTTSLWPDYPLALNKEKDSFVVYSSHGAGTACKYRYTNNQWIEEALPLRITEVTTNLLISDYNNRPNTVTLKTKMQRNADTRYWRDTKIGPDITHCDTFSK